MSLYKRPGSRNWWFRFQFKGRQIRGSAGTKNRGDAEQVEAKHKRDLWEEHRLGVKATKVWEEAAAAYVSQLPEGRNRRQTESTLRWLDPLLRGKPLHHIDHDVLTQVQAEKSASVARRAAEAKAAGHKPLTERARPGTINRVLGVVMAVLNFSARAGWVTRVPKIAHLPNPSKRIRYITREQAEALICELPAHLKPMVIFALETGLRKANVTRLRWAQVDLERRLAWVHPDEAKAGRGIAVPLTQRAISVLERQQGVHPEFVFTYRRQPVTQTSTKAWHKALARAGISNFRWHDLRHTWASWHRQSGTPHHVLKELGGWSDDRMVSRYAHLGVDHLAEYVARHEKIRSTEIATATASGNIND